MLTPFTSALSADVKGFYPIKHLRTMDRYFKLNISLILYFDLNLIHSTYPNKIHMEENYFFISDNINEIIFICYSTKTAYQISFSHQNLFHYFYNLPKIDDKFKLNNKRLHISKFIRLKDLTCYFNFGYYLSILTSLTLLTTLNTLKLNLRNISSFDVINVKNFTNLTRLRLKNDAYNNKFVYNHSLIKRLKNYPNLHIFSLTSIHCNVEIWTLTLDNNNFFSCFMCSKLTSLRLKSCSTQIVYFHENYRKNLLELDLGYFTTPHDYIFDKLTSLKIYNSYTSINLLNMKKLKKFTLNPVGRRRYKQNIDIQHTRNLHDLILNRIQLVNIGDVKIKNNDEDMCVIIDDNMPKLTRLKIKTDDKFDILIRNACNLQSLKSIEYNDFKFTSVDDFMKFVMTNKTWIVNGEIGKKEWIMKQYDVTHLVLINNKAFKNLDVLCDLRKVTYANEKSTYDCKNFRIRQEVKTIRMNVKECKEIYLKYMLSGHE